MTGGPRVSLQFPGASIPERLGVAVSGGSDSLALLHLLQADGRCALSAVTVNHGLRPEAASEALHVARLCEGLGVRHEIVDWAGWDGRGNLQDQARRSRYSLIADWARREGLCAVALGHTMDDVAETFLMRLGRGAGVDGLSAMSAGVLQDGIHFLRPLLHVERANLRDYLESVRIRWIEDPSNEDEAFDRVRARAALAALRPLGVGVPEIARSAAHLREARTALSAVASDWARARAKVVMGDVILDRTALGQLAPELERRILAGALAWVSGADYPPRSAPLSDLLAALHRGTAPGNTTLHGCVVMASGMTVRITREYAAVATLASPTDTPWDGRWTLEGPHCGDLDVRALGDAVGDCPDWRASGIPRLTLRASPAIWREDALIAAPVAGLFKGWTAKAPDLNNFASYLLAR